jgi:hypothetical protein
MSNENDNSGVKYLEIDQISPEQDLGDFIFTDNASNLTVLQMCLNKNIKHFVQKSNVDHVKEISLSQNMGSDPNSFLLFPLSTIFGQTSPSEETEKKLRHVFFEVCNPNEKYSLLGKIESYVKSLTKASSLQYEVLNASDELFTNAIYNAPFVDQGNDGGVERDVRKVTVESDKRPYFFAGHDQDRIVIGCSDKFGSLNIEKLLARIKVCYENDLASVINYSTGGAGIGAFMIFESSASVYIGVKQGVQTLVCCSFAYKLNSVSRRQLPKNLHIYSG